MEKFKYRSVEAFFMVNGKKGDFIYSHKQDRHITAISNYYNRLIQTERLLLVSNSNLNVKQITKITLK